MAEKLIGTVMGYYSNIGVVAVKLGGAVKLGDKIHIKGNTTDFIQEIDSMQINRKPVTAAKKGEDIGVKVIDVARKNDKVYKV